MQKGRRDLPDTFFIEPTTGRRYELSNAPYFSIECIFNNKNFWINLDSSRTIDEMNMEFEDDTSGEWEYVMLQPSDKKKHGDQEEEGDDQHDDEEEDDEEENAGGDKDEEVLDMPPPWSPKLFINKDSFLDLCPNGEKTVFYNKVKVDFYSDCGQVDGLVKRITIFDDYKRLIIKEIR